MKKNNLIKYISINIGMILFLFIIMLPLLIVFSSSLRSPNNMTSPLSMFAEISLKSYIQAYTKMNYPQAFFNSLILTGISAVAIVLLASAAAYPIARINTKFSNFISLFFLAGLIVPGQLALIPLYKVMHSLGIRQGMVSCILMYVTSGMPFSTFLYTGFIKNSVPFELEEAAVIDGAGMWYRFWIVVFPLITPATIAVLVTQSVWIWNDFLMPLLFITKANQKSLPLVMIRFLGDRENPTQWNQLFAACSLCTIPLLVVFSFLQKHFIGGITVGAVKG